MDNINIEIPIELRDFAKEFSVNRNQRSYGIYYSSGKAFKIEYLERLPESTICQEVKYLKEHAHLSQTGNEYNGTPTRIGNDTWLIQVNAASLKDASPDFVDFAIIIAWLTLTLQNKYNDDYLENLLRCDMIALRKFHEEGYDMSSIAKSAFEMFRGADTNLNRRRGIQLTKFLEDNNIK